MKRGLLIVALIFFGAAMIPFIWGLLSFILLAIAAIGAMMVACPAVGLTLIGVGAVFVLAIIGIISLFKGSGNPKTSDKK